MDLASLQHFNQLRNEHDLLGGVGEGPVFNESVQEEETQRWVLGQEEHGAAHEVFVEEMAGLHLMKRNDDILEENNVLLSQGHCETRNNTGQNIQQLRSSIEFEGLVDERVEAIVDSLTDHLSSGHQLGVQTM